MSLSRLFILVSCIKSMDFGITSRHILEYSNGRFPKVLAIPQVIPVCRLLALLLRRSRWHKQRPSRRGSCVKAATHPCNMHCLKRNCDLECQLLTPAHLGRQGTHLHPRQPS